MQNYREFTRKNLILIMIFCLIIGCSRKTDDHYNELGVNYINNGQYEYAIKTLKRAIKLNPSNAEAHFNLGRAYDGKGMNEKAKAQFSLSFNIDSETFDECVKKYKEKTDYEFVDTQHLNELGNAYLEKAMFDEAIYAFEKVLLIDPEDLHAHYSLGTIYSKKGIYDKAIDEFMSAIEADQGMPEAHYNLGLVYYKQGMFERAVSEYKTALTLLPETQKRRRSGVHYKLGIAYYDNKMFEDAIDELHKALELTPNEKRVHHQLSVIYKKAGMLKQAEKESKIYEKLKKQK
ncbi:MAG: hypothetical protein SCARUB_01703 [Candidatus Scalindua rubra]|uniref:Uncharacterized protein n=1 Tax=Candidatus Scalindua rubra TaxID=1872076 RepID=A0A1E3XBX4_9BACT|nr:MAG: hypothetical protein SCARUB_01703 [Candidatus Scalindua rubra]